MKDTVYLVLRYNKVHRLTKTPPPLNGYEIAIKLNINVSDKFFERFIPETNLLVPDSYVIEPSVQAKVVAMSKEELAELQKTIDVELEKHSDETEDDDDKDDEEYNEKGLERNPIEL